MSERALVPKEGWRVIDQWWLPQPVERLFIVLEAPDSASVCVGYDMQTKKWTMSVEPSD